MSLGFRVEHRPEEANPPELPWCVRRSGAIIWYRERKWADMACDLLNAGMSVEEAQRAVRGAPE